jgi:hypothetical protein
VPADLDELCVDLLAIDPEARPSPHAILFRLEVSDAASADLAKLTRSASAAPRFVGRDVELAALTAELAATRRGELRTVKLAGASGLGKTALLDRFCEQVRETYAGAVILRGRCFERETLPFKAFDGVITQLARFLRHMTEAAAAAYLPLSAALLPRIFPELGRVHAVSVAPLPARMPADPQELG